VSGIALVVVLIAQGRGDPMAAAFERAVRGVLGPEARIEIATSELDPPDDESAARAGSADGVVELSWSAQRARINCWVVDEKRWVEREISFGASEPRSERETLERGRLLGLTVATMFAEEAEAPREVAPALPEANAPAPPIQPVVMKLRDGPEPTKDGGRETKRGLEFAGTASWGIGGTAAGLGALAGLRLAWTGPLWSRFFVAGRAGSIPEAQATTRSLQLGAGLVLAASLAPLPLELGLRGDLFASYFEASHLSEDDVEPDRKSRWLPGGDLVLEGGYQLAPSAGLFVGGGVEAVAGRTDIYTHGERVAALPILRLLAEVGFRARF
jgi:hypothetical protein